MLPEEYGGTFLPAIAELKGGDLAPGKGLGEMFPRTLGSLMLDEAILCMSVH